MFVKKIGQGIIFRTKAARISCSKGRKEELCLSNRYQHHFSVIAQRQYHSYDHPPPPGPFTEMQSKILSAAITHIPKYGFTEISISRGAIDMGLIDATTNLFPCGAFSLVYYHLYTQRLALGSRLHLHQSHGDEKGNKNKDSLRGIGTKVKALTWWRLEANKDVIYRWSEALALMALRANFPTAMKELSLLVDEIWFLSGDTSVNTSWYTKRASLATIYASTELFMTTDKSLDFKETSQFLERRFQDVQRFGSTFGAVEQWGSFTASAMVNTLRSKGIPI